jgi:hypothetical protein
MLPNVPAFVSGIDEEAIRITPIEGFFDGEAAEV